MAGSWGQCLAGKLDANTSISHLKDTNRTKGNLREAMGQAAGDSGCTPEGGAGIVCGNRRCFGSSNVHAQKVLVS